MPRSSYACLGQCPGAIGPVHRPGPRCLPCASDFQGRVPALLRIDHCLTPSATASPSLCGPSGDRFGRRPIALFARDPVHASRSWGWALVPGIWGGFCCLRLLAGGGRRLCAPACRGACLRDVFSQGAPWPAMSVVASAIALPSVSRPSRRGGSPAWPPGGRNFVLSPSWAHSPRLPGPELAKPLRP